MKTKSTVHFSGVTKVRDIPWYITSKCRITSILYHAVENTAATHLKQLINSAHNGKVVGNTVSHIHNSFPVF